MSDRVAADRWSRVAQLFDEASTLAAAERAAFLETACSGDSALLREVESLFAFDHGDGEQLAAGIRDSLSAEAASLHNAGVPLQRLGPYVLRHEIGRGGMGSVFLAERADDFAQTVAIKLVRGFMGADELRRFRSERQILASLDHPGIARLLDGGTTPDGAPYLVMEYVDGAPIDEYCDRHHLGTRGRVELFCRVCDAVGYAHRRLVVHRDLKPSNILIAADGTPKLLDFGIAKLLEGDGADPWQTATSMRMMTPHYASPEQIRGEAMSTATDVYSLGVLLYTLLAGKRPYELDTRRPDEIERIVCGQDPARPSSVVEADDRRARELRGDLDTIVMKALQKEPGRRFASVDQLADDLRRFLDGRPVLARPSTWSYRTRRFIRRHRAGAVAAALFAIMAVGFAVALAVSAARARSERDAAERVTSMLIQMFSGSDPRSMRGDTITARELLDQGADQIRTTLRDRPDVQARLLDALGAIYLGLGLPDRAQSVLQDSMVARRSGGLVDSQPVARTMWRLSASLHDRGQYVAAEPLAREAYEMTRRLVGPVNPQSGETLNTLAMILRATGRTDEAERMFLEVTQIFRDTLGPEHPMVAMGLQNTARIRRDRGDSQGAERLLREALVIQRRIFGSVTGESLAMLAAIRAADGHPEEAESLFRESLAARRAAFGAVGHPALEQSLIDLADALEARGAVVEAEPLLREAMESRAARLGDEDPGTVELRTRHARVADQNR